LSSKKGLRGFYQKEEKKRNKKFPPKEFGYLKKKLEKLHKHVSRKRQWQSESVKQNCGKGWDKIWGNGDKEVWEEGGGKKKEGF